MMANVVPRRNPHSVGRMDRGERCLLNKKPHVSLLLGDRNESHNFGRGGATAPWRRNTGQLTWLEGKTLVYILSVFCFIFVCVR